MSVSIPSPSIVPEPPHPNLDKLSDVHDRSNEIGDFVMEFLRSKGYVLASWKWVRYGCTKDWVRTEDGVLVEYRRTKGMRIDDIIDIDPFECPCQPATPDQPFPHAKWELGMTNQEASIQPLLAEYFGIDFNAIEVERSALLSWVRERSEATR